MGVRHACGESQKVSTANTLLLLPAPRQPGKGNAFEVLGVSQDASLEDIKRAYRDLARRYHPDVNPSGHKEFVRITQAYLEATKGGDYTRLKLKCDVVEAKAAHAQFLQLVLNIKTLAGIEIPPVSSADMSKRGDSDRAFKLGFALMFRCPMCRWKKECDRVTGFSEVESFHYQFMGKTVAGHSKNKGGHPPLQEVPIRNRKKA